MLAIVDMVFQVFSASFIVVTAVIIKIFFKGDKKTKPKKRNMNNFKALNLFYCLMFFFTAASSLVNFILGYDINIVPFVIHLVVNAMLLSFLIMNEEARKYFQSKIKNWLNMRTETQIIEISMETQRTLWADRKRRSQSCSHGNNEIFVIDVEN